jgi:hypothetical protein
MAVAGGEVEGAPTGQGKISPGRTLGDCICYSRHWAGHISPPGIEVSHIQIFSKELVVGVVHVLSKSVRRACFAGKAVHRIRTAGISRVSDQATRLELLVMRHHLSIRWMGIRLSECVHLRKPASEMRQVVVVQGLDQQLYLIKNESVYIVSSDQESPTAAFSPFKKVQTVLVSWQKAWDGPQFSN